MEFLIISNKNRTSNTIDYGPRGLADGENIHSTFAKKLLIYKNQFILLFKKSVTPSSCSFRLLKFYERGYLYSESAEDLVSTTKNGD